MDPGRDCTSCHHKFTAAGTVYGSGAGGTGVDGAIVTITGSGEGQSVTLTTNSAGNFYTSSALTPPLTVELEYATTTATMSDAPDGGCNGCHGDGSRVHAP
jgi:hypothetical protein